MKTLRRMILGGLGLPLVALYGCSECDSPADCESEQLCVVGECRSFIPTGRCSLDSDCVVDGIPAGTVQCVGELCLRATPNLGGGSIGGGGGTPDGGAGMDSGVSERIVTTEWDLDSELVYYMGRLRTPVDERVVPRTINNLCTVTGADQQVGIIRLVTGTAMANGALYYGYLSNLHEFVQDQLTEVIEDGRIELRTNPGEVETNDPVLYTDCGPVEIKTGTSTVMPTMTSVYYRCSEFSATWFRDGQSIGTPCNRVLAFGDGFALCTDGLVNMATNTDIPFGGMGLMGTPFLARQRPDGGFWMATEASDGRVNRRYTVDTNGVVSELVEYDPVDMNLTPVDQEVVGQAGGTDRIDVPNAVLDRQGTLYRVASNGGQPMGMIDVELLRFDTGTGRIESLVVDRDDCDITDLRVLAP